MRRDSPEVVALQETRYALPAPAAEVVAAFDAFVTDERKARIEAVLAHRTRAVIPVLERLSDPHNAAAILRSCDAFGVQEAHVIDEQARFVASSRVAKGAERWLDLVRHDSTRTCLEGLRARGYRVLVASMEGTHTPEELSSIERVALVFGNEHHGVSAEMRELADGSYRIPMRGFVESLNVSVAAAITLHAALLGRKQPIDADDAMQLRARFYVQTVDRGQEILRNLFPR